MVFKIFCLPLKLLKIEDELSLAFLFGKRFKEIEYMDLKKPKYVGVILRCLIFFKFIVKNFVLTLPKFSKEPIYVYAGTDNQFNSLNPVVKALKNKGIGFYLSVGYGVSRTNRIHEYAVPIKFSFKVLLAGFWLFLIRGWPLYQKLKRMEKTIEISWYFNKFCEVYIYLPYFISVLCQVSPKVIIVSNDHNVSNRCLRLAAEFLEIKTVYMQHASVSDVFPPLEFDYALLDGFIAHETYKRCYQLQNEINPRVERNVKKCHVILSGQKKEVVDSNKDYHIKDISLGLAVNQIDDFFSVKTVLKSVSEMEIKCTIRTHPFQKSDFISSLCEYIQDKPLLTWSDSRDQPLSDYFKQINALVAGNTSIHLEAALADLPTFYLEMSQNVIKPDYYGYVRNGISTNLEKEFSKEVLVTGIENCYSSDRSKAIKSYSETYGTSWQNREGVLGALIIESILNAQSLSSVFTTRERGIYRTVLSLSTQDCQVETTKNELS